MRFPEGLELLIELLRDGHKHNAGVLVGSHDAHDVGPDTEEGRIALGLIRHRFLFRQTQKTLVKSGLQFMGLYSADPFCCRRSPPDSPRCTTTGGSGRSGRVSAWRGTCTGDWASCV